MEDPMSQEQPENARELEEVLREQEAEPAVIRSRSEQAPPRLRSWLAQELARRRRETRRRLAVATACAVAAALVITLVIALQDGSEEVTVADAAAAGARPATEPAPPTGRNEYLLDRSLEQIPFPNWRKRGWRAVGARRDRIDGRTAETVFYERSGRRVAYTIVSGSPLSPGDGARSVRARVEFTRLALDGRAVVTWRRKGHTCVLSGTRVPQKELLNLASWKAYGKTRRSPRAAPSRARA
jgi:hypothetical protein